jgi:hypothetical protein
MYSEFLENLYFLAKLYGREFVYVIAYSKNVV